MEQIENQDVSEGGLSLACKRRTKRKRTVSIKLGNLSLAYRAEAMQQQMTTNVKTSCNEIITESNKADYISISIPQSKNFPTLSEKNAKKIKYVRKKLKQNKNEEKMEQKNKKKLKNIEATQQQMTTNVKTDGAKMIDDSNEEDYINTPIFIQESENFATLSEKNVNEINDVRKKLKQNKNGEKKEKKIKKKFKNIEVTQQQMTTNGKAAGAEMIDDSSVDDHVHNPISIEEPKNVATLSKKNVKELKDVRKKLKQNKNEEEMKNKNKKKLKNIEVTQQQMTTNVKASCDEIIIESSKADYISVSIPQSKNFATLSEKNAKKIKYVRKKLKQNKYEEEMEQKNKKKLKNIEATQQQMTTNVKADGAKMIDDSNKEDYMNTPIFIQESENFATLSEKNVKEIKDVRKTLKQNKNGEKKEKKIKKKFKNIEVTQQQMTTNGKAAGAEMINDSSVDNYMHNPIFIQELENVVTLSERNVKEIKDVRKKLKQNKNEEEMKNKNKKKLKNIEVTQQQMTTNVKADGAKMIDDSNKEDYMNTPIFIQESENFATLSEKNVKEIKDVRKKLKQNKSGEKEEKKIKKKFKNIEVTQQQMTTNGKAAGAEMINDSSVDNYMHNPIFIQEPENVATLSEKNVKEIKDVRKKLKQNKNEEEMEEKSKKKFKNIEITQQQMTTIGKAAGAEMIDDSSKEDYMNTPIFTQESENVATLSEKNVKEIKDVRKELEQNRNEEKEEKIDKNKLKNIGATQQQMTTTVKVSHNEIITEPNKADCIRVPVYIPQSENFATLPEKNDKIIKYVPEKFEQSPQQVDKDSLTELLTDFEEKINKMLNNETKAMKLLEDIETNDESIIIRRQIQSEDKVTDAKTENDDVNNNCQTTVNNKNKEHGYTLNETIEKDQVIKIVEENEIKEIENTDPGTTSNETLRYVKDVILQNNGKMTNGILMVEDISNVAHKIDKKLMFRRIGGLCTIENMFSRLLFFLISLLLLLLFCNCE